MEKLGMYDWSVIVASNNDEVLNSTLKRSPDLEAAREVHVKRGFCSAGTAYNSGLDATRSDIVVFIHQDVYLPPGWWSCLQSVLSRLADSDPYWGVLGVFGLDTNGGPHGYVYSTGLRRVVGSPLSVPAEVASLDELLLVVRRSSGLRFDPNLPGFHLYGTDLCLESSRQGMKNYAVPAFCIHNSIGISLLPPAYWRAYRYVRKKWFSQLPVHTPCASISRWPLIPLLYYLRQIPARLLHPCMVGQRHPDPAALYAELDANILQKNGNALSSESKCDSPNERSARK